MTKYIVFEGVDGLGKSTQINLLKKIYKNSIFTQEPGATDIGKQIRQMIFNNKISSKTELFLFLADRCEHYNKLIEPNLIKNSADFIFSDRSYISGIAYAMDKFDEDFLINLNNFSMDNTKPSAIVFFKGDKELINQRLDKRKIESGLDLIEKRGVKYFLNIQENMQKLIEKLQIKYIIIDAKEPIDSAHKTIKDFLDGTSN